MTGGLEQDLPLQESFCLEARNKLLKELLDAKVIPDGHKGLFGTMQGTSAKRSGH
jgi:hypothetical protein